MAEERLSQLLQQRRQKARALLDAGIELYADHFPIRDHLGEIRGRYEQYSDQDLERETRVFVCAGRIMAVRSFGRATFITLQDATGRLQVYVKREEVGEENYRLFKKFDIGDLIGIQGRLFRTRAGELTLLAREVKLLTKSLRPLPEKFHGLKDVESRYRQRYLDLIANQSTRELFILRARLIQEIRNFLTARGFLEVETPMMQPIPGGATARPFKTYHNALGMDLYLRVAPELYLKRLLVGGFERVFEINRNFRNEGISLQHNPEFTMLEFYQSYATYEDLLPLTEELICSLARLIRGSLQFQYQGTSIDLSPPWPRYRLKEALITFGGLDAAEIDNKQKLQARARGLGIEVDGRGTGKIITRLFEALVEPKLQQPTFITHFPLEVSPLSRRSQEDPSVADRFELFIGGRELANGFSELNDPLDQKERFEEQVTARKAGDEEAHFMDEDYIRALEYGMPPAAGEGLGIDRLVMLFADVASIREVILFPHLRPETRQDR